MDNLNELQLDKLTRASIELAQAASDYGALRVTFGVFMAIFLLMVLSQLVQSWVQQRRLKVIEDICIATSKCLTEQNDHTVGREEAKMLIRESLGKSEALMKYYVLKMRMENHLGDRAFTQGKIAKIVGNDSDNRKAFLSKFVCLGHTLGFTAVDGDDRDVADMLAAWIYRKDGEFTVSLMAQELSLYYDGLKTRAAMKIDGMPEG